MPDPDDFDLDDDIEPTQQTENSNIQQMRQQIKELEKQLRSEKKQATELAEFKANYEREQRGNALKGVFEELGLNPSLQRLFNVDNPDAEPSREVVAPWAAEQGFITQPVEPTTDTFVPTTSAPGGSVGTGPVPYDEWLNISMRDPAEGQRLLNEGRVDRSSLYAGLGPDK